MTDAMTKNLVLSPSGISHTFDANADGYGRGEAINCIYLKPLKCALRDNDTVRAIIRSTITNHDGKTPIFSNPCPISQEKLIRHAYQIAGIEGIDETPVFECHGTGTAVGDVIEASVVGKVTQGRKTYLTAVSYKHVTSICQISSSPRDRTGKTECRPLRGSIWHHQYYQSHPVT
jgi:acyl transferase domain-containing protein